MSRTTRDDRGFSPVTMIVVLLVGVLSLGGLGVLSAYSPELKSGDDGGGHALSRAATGYAALPRLLRAVDVPVLLSRGPLGPNAGDSLLVLTPTVQTRPEQISDLSHPGPILIVLPKWQAGPYADHPGWSRTFGVLSPEDSLAVLPDDLRAGAKLEQGSASTWLALQRPSGLRIGAPIQVEAPRHIVGDGWIPVLIDGTGGAVLAMHRDTRTYVLADADLLSTHGLKTLAGAQTAVAMLDLLRAGDAPVAFDLTLHGFQRSRNLTRLLLEPPLLGMTLVLIALGLFAGLQAAVRFGPAREGRRVVALGKRALADNTAALVRLARREHHMAAPYALLVRAAVARAVGAPRALSDGELDAFLDRVGVTTGATVPYTALAQTARAAKTPGDLMRVARDLYRWNQEMTRARQ